MNVIYGFEFCNSNSYAHSKEQDKFTTVARLPVMHNGKRMGMAYPRWSEHGHHLLMDFVFDCGEEEWEHMLNLYPHKMVDVRKVGKLVTSIELLAFAPVYSIYGGYLSYAQQNGQSLHEHIRDTYPSAACKCGAGYTSLPTFHYDFCSIKKGPAL